MERVGLLLVATACVALSADSLAWAAKKPLQGVPLPWKPTDAGKMGTVQVDRHQAATAA